MPIVNLHCHPDTACPFLRGVEVDVRRAFGHELRLIFRIAGDLSQLALPEPGESRRSDDLWRHSCCEAFIRKPPRIEYYEFNFSPSTAWAIYRFSAYRSPLPEPSIQNSPQILPTAASQVFELDVVLDLNGLGLGTMGLELGLATVIESRAGELSYWALAHPPGRPDYHHPDSFALTIASMSTSASY